MALKNIPFTILNSPPPPPSRVGRVSALRAALEGLEVGQALTIVVNGPSEQSSARTMAYTTGRKTGRTFVTAAQKLNDTETQVTIWRTA